MCGRAQPSTLPQLAHQRSHLELLDLRPLFQQLRVHLYPQSRSLHLSLPRLAPPFRMRRVHNIKLKNIKPIVISVAYSAPSSSVSQFDSSSCSAIN